MPDPHDSDSLPDDVPFADAVEQARPVVESADAADAVIAEEPPLESNESDWQEQLLEVDDPEEDFR